MTGEKETCWLQLTSGRGPVECQRAVALLAPVICGEGRANGLKVDVIDTLPGREAGVCLSIVIAVSGVGAEGFARQWAGSVQWICKSPYRAKAKRKNWFVGVDVLYPPADVDAVVHSKDVRIEAFRASGAGGQHVNTTDSAVRLAHLPSGLVVVAREERSQHMNRKLALARLAALLAAQRASVREAADRERWARHEQLQRGAPVRVFVGESFSPR